MSFYQSSAPAVAFAHRVATLPDSVERYLRGSGSGVKESSYYGTLEALLNEVGAGLSPKVRCVIQIKNSGAGLPDGVLFTADQLRAYWRNVPAAVWSFTIGGYPVLKKWLSYREADLLGRPQRGDEARLVTQIARRIAAILLLQPELDANYRAVAAATVEWARLAKPTATLSLWGD